MTEAVPARAKPHRPWWKLKRVLIPAGFVAIVIVANVLYPTPPGSTVVEQVEVPESGPPVERRVVADPISTPPVATFPFNAAETRRRIVAAGGDLSTDLGGGWVITETLGGSVTNIERLRLGSGDPDNLFMAAQDAVVLATVIAPEFMPEEKDRITRNALEAVGRKDGSSVCPGTTCFWVRPIGSASYHLDANPTGRYQ